MFHLISRWTVARGYRRQEVFHPEDFCKYTHISWELKSIMVRQHNLWFDKSSSYDPATQICRLSLITWYQDCGQNMDAFPCVIDSSPWSAACDSWTKPNHWDTSFSILLQHIAYWEAERNLWWRWESTLFPSKPTSQNHISDAFGNKNQLRLQISCRSVCPIFCTIRIA